MDLQKLKAFVTVAQELNFRKSAEILGMSQPPLTRLIAALEEELSSTLFERTTRQVKLTAAGVYLLAEAREILAAIEKIETETKMIGKMKTGRLRIGFSTAAFLAKLPKIIDEFQIRSPKIKIELVQESPKQILRGVRQGHFDLGFLEGNDDEQDLSHHAVQDQVLGILLPRKHPAAKRKELNLSDLKDDVFILHPQGEAEVVYQSFQRLFKEAGFKPQVYVKNEREACPILVATGRGVSLTIAGSQRIAPDETVFIPLKNSFLPVSVYWRPDNQEPSLKSFLSFVTESHATKSKGLECVTDVSLARKTS